MVRHPHLHPPHTHCPVNVSSAVRVVSALVAWALLAATPPGARAQDPSKVPPTGPSPSKDGSAAGPAAMTPGRFLVGDNAPDINLRDSNGKQFQLSKAYKDRPWLIVFTRVPEDAVDVERAFDGLSELGIGAAVIAPFSRDKLADWVPNPRFRLLIDRSSRAARVYGNYDAVSSNPRRGVVLVDRHGKIRLMMSGGIPTSSEIVRLSKEALEAAGERPVTGEARAGG